MREDQILWYIFQIIGTDSKFAVEIGAGDGVDKSNTRIFLDNGWRGLQIDGFVYTDKYGNVLSHPDVKHAIVTQENVSGLLLKHDVPNPFDLLSIDIDGNDYWVWKAIDHEVMVVVIEYNCNFGYGQQCVLEYDPCNRWDNTVCYGASLSALESLGAKKGYYLYQECNFSNLIFVNNRFKSILPPAVDPSTLGLPKTKWAQSQTKKFINL
jgi:hypothetical protein